MKNAFILVITGLSGSGKSTALKAIEDEGFFCMDNMPIDLMDKFLELYESASFTIHKVCICMDARAGAPYFAQKAPLLIAQLRNLTENVRLIFLESGKENLLNRYKETRRRHPLSESYPNLLDAIEAEVDLLAPLRGIADFIVNTSQLNVHQLAARIKEIISTEDRSRDMYIEVSSFGFKKGIPMDSDIVMDVRFLPNPYFVDELKDKTGSDREVKDFLRSSEVYEQFLSKFKDLISFILPLCKKEGRSYLNISIGCTGGRHRSVAIAEEIRQAIEDAGYPSRLKHRDIV
ncbi:MAG TPA: RNase adapter RapZ [Deltaproteobacteria bacterium]|nr:RNase adapter RapZ [Deltaproteobacteria bacterium]HPR53513.1 RNase adapter RapZ [Deltaproteobacteria bacterium]HXK46150.1 RNase adapter RapZ [Deltaproteobacteria bacterium]